MRKVIASYVAGAVIVASIAPIVGLNVWQLCSLTLGIGLAFLLLAGGFDTPE